MAVIRKGSHDLHYQHLAKDKDKDKGSLYLSKGLLGGVRVRGWWEGLSPGLLITS